MTPTSGADDQIKALIGIDAKDAEGMKAAMQRMSMLAQEMEVGNVVTFDKRKRLLTGKKGGFGGGKASEDKKRETEGDKLVKLLKKEMENRKSRLPYRPPESYSCTLRYDRRNSSQTCSFPDWRTTVVKSSRRAALMNCCTQRCDAFL